CARITSKSLKSASRPNAASIRHPYEAIFIKIYRIRQLDELFRLGEIGRRKRQGETTSLAAVGL
ncbi:MAG: hypothetical protein PHO14_07540, partial [Kiritimatiellae bacterium]|nr:hypothetical protein [Kiritimatiellia bacterium]MDD4342072.1 hypothetical protein [Kiritimatiellia bacterium]